MKKLAILFTLALASTAAAQGTVKSLPPHPMFATEAAPAVIIISLPGAAQVWFDGHLTTTTGQTRRYETEPIVSGTYKIKVRHNGKERTQDVTVHGGKRITLSFYDLVGEVSQPAIPFAEPDVDTKAAGQWPRTPKGERYVRAKFTQEIAVTNGRDRITAVPRSHLQAWTHHSGGMEGVQNFRSEVYRQVPGEALPYVANLGVLNSFGYIQYNRGWVRSYPDGTRFDDVLSNEKTGRVFEHRVAFKDRGVWTRKVVFSDVSQRPVGYSGLKQSCSSCHDQAGTGGYATGMIPGADTILSDPFPELERQ